MMINSASFTTYPVRIAILWLLIPCIARGEQPGWPSYGGDAGGQRYSSARQITPANVANLEPAWTYSTGDMSTHRNSMYAASFEDTPILADGRLYICSPFNEISALDPGTGKQLWRYDPHVEAGAYEYDATCRGVVFWRNTQPGSDVACRTRIFVNTNDRRLIAIDAARGTPCEGFGTHGMVRIDSGRTDIRANELRMGSPPVVTHNVVIVGSAIDDDQRIDEVRGTVRAFDAITGVPRWSFDPLSKDGPTDKEGAANVWAPMSVDEERGLVFLPTSSPSPDYYGAQRPGNNGYADSVVAVSAETGAVRWSFQITHHDVWDYDVAAQPTLATVTYQGHRAAAVLQPTKQGLLFTLNRDTGEPLIPVVERAVPQGGELGERLSPTQPFPIAPVALAPNHIRPEDAFGLTPLDRNACRDRIAAARNEGLYTPPSVQGTIMYPFTGGGTNWGGLAFDESNDVVYVNTSSAIHVVTLIPRDKFAAEKQAHPNLYVAPQAGTPFGIKRELLLSPIGIPCNPPPWGMLHAIDMHDGHVRWEVPLGTTRDTVPLSQLILGNTGTPNFGGPIVTAGGLVFIGATMDKYLRAFDASNGKELWRGRLPAAAQATPLTYMWQARQYVVIAAGGHAKLGTKRGDWVVAFALPQK